MEEWIILIGYRIDLLNLSLLAKKNINDTSNESIACIEKMLGVSWPHILHESAFISVVYYNLENIFFLYVVPSLALTI